jgi:hypothetical protein
MLSNSLHEIGDFIAVAMLVPLLLFVGYYRRSPWRSTELGIAVMVQKSAIALLVINVVIANYLPESWKFIFVFVRLVIFIIVLALLVIDFINLRRIQVDPKKRLIFHWLLKPRK